MPFIRKENKGQSSSMNSIQNKKTKKNATPAATQSSLLSFLKKELPTPEAETSNKRKISESPELPLTPVTPKSQREKNIQIIDNEPVNNVKNISIDEVAEESTSGGSGLRVNL
jgi:hypothetical protein